MDTACHAHSGSEPTVLVEWHLADQPLHCLAPPRLESALKRAQIPFVLSVGIPSLEVDQELQGDLIRIGVQRP
jgi:hypothetical protein